MATRDFVIELIFLSQNIFGILGNFSLLYHYLFLYCTGYRLRTVDLIVKNLIVGNILVLFSAGFHSTMTNFGWNHLNSGSACRFFAYVRGVGRGTSIGITCILSVFQAITISPRNSRWGQLKMKAPKYIGSTIFICWGGRMLINIRFTRYMKDQWSNRNITKKKDLGLCFYGLIHNRIKVLLNVGWFLLPAVSCLVFMISVSYTHLTLPTTSRV